MRTVIARLDIGVFVDCPRCEQMIDLTRQEDTSYTDHNEEGGVISQACPNGNWSEEHKKFSIRDVMCSDCDEVFNVEGLEW